MAVGENHPLLKHSWVEYSSGFEVMFWECSDPECGKDSTFVVDLIDTKSDRYSAETTRLLREGRCPKDHWMLIF